MSDTSAGQPAAEPTGPPSARRIHRLRGAAPAVDGRRRPPRVATRPGDRDAASLSAHLTARVRRRRRASSTGTRRQRLASAPPRRRGAASAHRRRPRAVGVDDRTDARPRGPTATPDAALDDARAADGAGRRRRRSPPTTAVGARRSATGNGRPSVPGSATPARPGPPDGSGRTRAASRPSPAEAGAGRARGAGRRPRPGGRRGVDRGRRGRRRDGAETKAVGRRAFPPAQRPGASGPPGGPLPHVRPRPPPRHPDRRARGPDPGRALRVPGGRRRHPDRRQHLPGPGPERAAGHGSGVHRHRHPQERRALPGRRPLRRRGRRDGQERVAAHRGDAAPGPGHLVPGHQEPDRSQGGPPDPGGVAAGSLRGHGAQLDRPSASPSASTTTSANACGGSSTRSGPPATG